MARNKYPQETVNKILDVSQALFISRGYEHTSIQDIIDGLGGLSKGAIYHHFKSKEDILSAVIDRLFEGKEARMDALVADKSLTGREKLILATRDSLEDPNQDQLFEAAPDMLKNPWLLSALLNDTFYAVVPQILQPIVEQGVADGSFTTDQPRELAQVVALLCNLWVNPAICRGSGEEIALRLEFLNKLLAPFGLDIMDREASDHVLNYQRLFNQKNPD